jgi:asparagine synthase (glutamine-hydrolysing)
MVTGGSPADVAATARMSEAIVHRGPDEHGADAFGRCALGHRRLSVMDPRQGHQPQRNEDATVHVVYNGEAYNFKALRAELEQQGHRIPGHGDTALVPHLYEQHGLGFVERLEGMFALALWDATRERLVLARDRLGKKPLLWTRLPDGTLAFASELKALLQLPQVSRELDLRALDGYLSLQYVPGTATPLRGVQKLAPGHYLVLERGEVTIERYWTPAPRAPEGLTSRADWLDAVRDTVTDAVRERMVADVPVGALLSGGIDSSVVVALMAQQSREPVHTFSVGFSDARYDERLYARAVAERYGTVHTELVLEPDVQELLPRLAWTLDEPLGDEAVLPTYLISEVARRDVTVALGGDGGDEAFAGYERYVAGSLAGRVPPALARAGARVARGVPGARREPRSTAARAARLLELAGTSPADRYGRLMEVWPAALRAELWTEDAQREIGAPRPAAQLLGPPRAPGITGLQLLDVETYLPGDLLYKADMASMACSLELRSPFLDRRVIELGLALPEELKATPRRGKIALREAFAELLPIRIASRRKAGFGVPISRWLRADLRPLAAELLLDERARSRGQLQIPVVKRLLDEHVSGRRDHGHRLWCLLMLELWQRLYVDAPAPRRVDDARVALAR